MAVDETENDEFDQTYIDEIGFKAFGGDSGTKRVSFVDDVVVVVYPIEGIGFRRAREKKMNEKITRARGTRKEVEAVLGHSQAKNAVGKQIRVQVWQNCGAELEVQFGPCRTKSTEG